MGEGHRQTAAYPMRVTRIDLRPDIDGQPLGLSLWLPESDAPTALFFCLPGGHMTRDYFDLRVPGNDSHSFACAMTARGFAVAAMDHPGIGGSDDSDNGGDIDDGGDLYRHTPESLADAAAGTCGWLCDELRAGNVVEGMAPLPRLQAIGLGHSMGAMITVLAQQRHRAYSAVAVLGFSTRGLPEYVPADVQALLKDRDTLKTQRVALARALFARMGEGNGRGGSGNDADIYGREGAEADGIRALAGCRAPLLPVPAFCSMLPDNVGPEAAEISVPVFIGLGSRDMAGPPHQVPAAFSGSDDVTLKVLPATGHSHFLFPSRAGLFRRLAHWATYVAARETLSQHGVESTS